MVEDGQAKCGDDHCLSCYPPRQLELSAAQIDAIAEAVVAKLAEREEQRFQVARTLYQGNVTVEPPQNT